ncbi:deoxyribodipyrimidine photolyase [Bordetella sp. H567]|uniref:deoxyribodipyrimidine photo-lyase n=1 Tax=Bordetella sp. H567 TaxID=1697043 RepID=UPI00081CDF10|nr:deoxyribodipyrimidine photo-lyase [Bordetella sp. H567]AOB33639.1 deoxyribodipyrimidine photolyase [Bordetella sp. H567]
MATLIWLRTDLRTQDNPALSAALAQDATYALFMPAPGQWQRHGDAPVKIDFWLRNLAQLRGRLGELNVPLKFTAVPDWSDAPEALAAFCRRHDIRAVHVNAEWGVNECRRDRAVAERLAAEGIAWTVHHGATLLRPGTIVTGKGECYKVFTPYARVCRERLAAAPPRAAAAPRAQPALPAPADPLPTPRMMLGDAQAPGDALRNLWPAGEDAAARRLDTFIDTAIGDYPDQRDLPGVDGTSRLSPYLAAGVISPGACLRAALSANQGELDSGRAGVRAWITELLWREFYLHLLAAHPGLSMHRPMRPETEHVPWRDASQDLRAWREGRTGFPIIDAAMRQLDGMGWMHNRLRMMTAMFLCKNLLLDWRQGEAWFMSRLIDGDLASNNGGWQWSASTGTDAVPYFRVFNPETQSRKFDPRGHFLRHWLPELAGLDDRAIHAPSDAQRQACGYPPRIVDLRASRLRAIEAYAGASRAVRRPASPP